MLTRSKSKASSHMATCTPVKKEGNQEGKKSGVLGNSRQVPLSDAESFPDGGAGEVVSWEEFQQVLTPDGKIDNVKMTAIFGGPLYLCKAIEKKDIRRSYKGDMVTVPDGFKLYAIEK